MVKGTQYWEVEQKCLGVSADTKQAQFTNTSSKSLPRFPGKASLSLSLKGTGQLYIFNHRGTRNRHQTGMQGWYLPSWGGKLYSPLAPSWNNKAAPIHPFPPTSGNCAPYTQVRCMHWGKHGCMSTSPDASKHDWVGGRGFASDHWQCCPNTEYFFLQHK